MRTVRQVRLDLEMFNLVDPDITGNCRTDYMQVTVNYEQHLVLLVTLPSCISWFSN